MTDWKARLTEEDRDALIHSDMADWTQPTLTTPAYDHFSSPEWICEHQLDGERCLAFRRKIRALLGLRDGKRAKQVACEEPG